MPIKHIVLLPFKSTLSKSEIDQVRLSLSNLTSVIPEILTFSWCENNSLENLHRGYMHGFIMEFKNHEDREVYLAHPDHVAVAQDFILPALIDGINSPVVFDYETE